MIELPRRELILPDSADPIAAPFIARGHKNLVCVEGNQDRAFRESLLAIAPEPARKHFREAFLNGPKGDGGRHATAYFGAEKIAGIQAQIHPVCDEIEEFMARTLRFPGFNQWLTLTGWGDDYRIIKGLIAWAETASGNAPPHDDGAEWRSVETIPTDRIVEIEASGHGVICVKRDGAGWLKVDRQGNRLGGILLPIAPERWRDIKGDGGETV